MKIFFLFCAGFWALSSAWAALPPIGRASKSGISQTAIRDTDAYRIGDEWGKKAVSAADLSRATPAFARAALATAHVGGATGFYLGKFHGAHVMATNHHVYPSSWHCTGATVRFPLLGVVATCERFLGSWDQVDLALFTVRVAPADEAKLAPVAGNFRFYDDVTPGEKLLTVGFGSAGNDLRQVMANQDSDCYVFSEAGEYRLMADPDQYNPGPYRAWSFALGCDVSHGDSGSAIVDRETSAVVGIIWTGRVPKSTVAQSSTSLTQMFTERQEAIWQELSYAVPAKKIGEFLSDLLPGALPEETKAILRDLLAQP